jgi:methylmalonyl-CoA mutase N-terminal domain/subunit
VNKYVAEREEAVPVLSIDNRAVRAEQARSVL